MTCLLRVLQLGELLGHSISIQVFLKRKEKKKKERGVRERERGSKQGQSKLSYVASLSTSFKSLVA